MKHTLVMLAALALTAGSGAQSKVQISPDGRPSKIAAPRMGLNAQDKMSIMNAKVSNIFEVRSSQIALKRGINAWTRDFAKGMVKDHSAAHEELKLIAKRKGIRLDKKLPAMQMATLQKLRNCPRGQFDAMYREVQIMGHKETAMKFEKGIRLGNDGDVKGYLIKSLPAVKMHLKAAEMKMPMGHSM